MVELILVLLITMEILAFTMQLVKVIPVSSVYFLKMVELILVLLITMEILAFTMQLMMAMTVLLEDGRADPSAVNYDGDNCLHISAKNGHESIVSLLLEDGRVDPGTINMGGLDCLSVTFNPTIRKMLKDDKINRLSIASVRL
jgi:ankyrin repeat protein